MLPASLRSRFGWCLTFRRRAFNRRGCRRGRREWHWRHGWRDALAIGCGLRIACDVEFAIPLRFQKTFQKVLAHRQCRSDGVDTGKLLERFDILFGSQQFFAERDAALAQQIARLVTRLAAAITNIQSDRETLL